MTFERLCQVFLSFSLSSSIIFWSFQKRSFYLQTSFKISIDADISRRNFSTPDLVTLLLLSVHDLQNLVLKGQVQLEPRSLTISLIVTQQSSREGHFAGRALRNHNQSLTPDKAENEKKRFISLLSSASFFLLFVERETRQSSLKQKAKERRKRCLKRSKNI